MRRFVIACLAVAGLAGTIGVDVNAANPSAALGQWANLDAQWVNGNLGASKSTYYEGDDIPYRLVFDNLSLTSHQVTIEWDTTKSGKHALDYLTTFNYRVGQLLNTPPPLTPCTGIIGCGALSQTKAIPADPQVTAAGITAPAGVFSIYGGTVTAVSPYSYVDGAGFVGDKSARITITFTATQANPVLAWGGHIATRRDWGLGLSAVAISGSPYHTRLIGLDGPDGGNQDRSLSAAAVIYPAVLNVVKDVQTATAGPDSDSTAFGFSATGQIAGPFSLTDDGLNLQHETKTYSNMLLFGSANTVTVTEATTPGFTQSASCAINDPGVGGGSASTAGLVATVVPAEGLVATCTYVNRRANGTLTVIKNVINDNGGQAQASSFAITVKSGSTNVCSTPTPGVASPGFSCSLPGGTYVVSEDVASGYTQTGFSADCPNGVVSLPAGGSKTCTITNNDQPATLTVIKHVVNDNGGTKTAGDFTMNVTAGNPSPASFAGSEAGTIVTIDAGNFSVTEGTVSGYTQTGAVGCTGTVVNGGTATCTITNDDAAATLIVKKIVINDNGGTGIATGFTFKVNNGSPITFIQSSDALHGENSLSVNAGTYSVVEPAVSGYNTPLYDNCSNVVIANGQTKTCTITNDDAPAGPGGSTVQRAVLHDKLTISGIRLGAPVDAQHPAASVTFSLYSDDACTAQVGASEGPLSIAFLDQNVPTTGTATTVSGFLVSASQTTVYYWRAQYTGDQYNNGFTTDCKAEKTTVVFEP